MTAPLALLSIEGPVARLTLNRPERHNSLIPELIGSLLTHLQQIAANKDTRVLILQAAGRSFSTGGDVQGFFSTPRAERRAYAQKLIGGLNEAILALLDLTIPVIGRIHGPVTGGSLGFVLACDLVAVTPQAFIQPYYTQVGFSPDGGWTALLPDRIGAAKAREIQLLNRPISAEEAVQLGLATTLATTDVIDGVIADWIAALLDKRPGAMTRTKALLLTAEQRRRVQEALAAEAQSFMEQIDSEEAEAGMARFLAKSA
jgi:2-(1,2-epoxy-1,2-dihydrophenyl)acetyl-CoA isomerase